MLPLTVDPNVVTRKVEAQIGGLAVRIFHLEAENDALRAALDEAAARLTSLAEPGEADPSRAAD